jgi:hypothetical protein
MDGYWRSYTALLRPKDRYHCWDICSADINRQLNYPVIDADGHWIEFEPTLLEYLNGVAGATMVDRFRREDYLADTGSSSRMAIAERVRRTAAFFDALVQRHAIRPRDWDRLAKPRRKVS